MNARLLRLALAGATATCAGNGLARFAYVPIFPAMVTAGWVDGGQAGMLGAAALAGYLVGTLLARQGARRFGVKRMLDAGMGLIVIALAACAWNGGFTWLMAWRGLAGIAGGFLMAMAGPATQASVPPHWRGTAGGVVIAGVGSGIALGALLVPLLLPVGLPATWMGLAGLVAALWALAHRFWPDMEVAAATAAPPAGGQLLMLTYGLHGAGMVPPMVYLADLAARGRGLGLGAGAMVWLLFGLCGVLGGVVSGRVTDRIGGRRTLLYWLIIQGAALALAVLPGAAAVLASAALSGFAAVGVSAVTLSVCRELSPVQAGALWVRCTAAFGVVQAVMGFALAALFAATGESHAAVFTAGLVFSLLALVNSLRLQIRRPAPT